MAKTKRQSRIAIIGTGLIGASIGLRLAQRSDRGYDLIGLDRDRSNARRAKSIGAVDEEVGSLEEALAGTGLVILAVPAGAAQRLLADMGPYLAEGAIVTDVTSTKSAVMAWAGEFLPEGVHFVGGHPIAGKERSGPDAADPALFEGATWAITPSPTASEQAVGVVLGLVESLGATPVYIDAMEHDQYLAAVSHLPLVLSVALFRMVRDSTAWEDLALLAGPGFRDMTRLASGDPEMGRDIIGTNRDAIVHWLHRLRTELETIEHAVASGPDVVNDLLKSTAVDRDTYMMNPPQRRAPEGQPLPSSRDAIGRLFAGGLYDKLKEAETRIPGMGDDSSLRERLDPGRRSDDEKR
jgi:prephenate dehydrogenase